YDGYQRLDLTEGTYLESENTFSDDVFGQSIRWENVGSYGSNFNYVQLSGLELKNISPTQREYEKTFICANQQPVTQNIKFNLSEEFTTQELKSYVDQYIIEDDGYIPWVEGFQLYRP